LEPTLFNRTSAKPTMSAISSHATFSADLTSCKLNLRTCDSSSERPPRLDYCNAILAGPHKSTAERSSQTNYPSCRIRPLWRAHFS